MGRLAFFKEKGARIFYIGILNLRGDKILPVISYEFSCQNNDIVQERYEVCEEYYIDINVDDILEYDFDVFKREVIEEKCMSERIQSGDVVYIPSDKMKGLALCAEVNGKVTVLVEEDVKRLKMIYDLDVKEVEKTGVNMEEEVEALRGIVRELRASY